MALKTTKCAAWAVITTIVLDVLALAVLPSRWDKACFTVLIVLFILLAALSLLFLKCPACGGQLHLFGQKFCPSCGKAIEE